jgi:hypothetical protein
MGFVRIHLTDPYIDDEALRLKHTSLFHYTSLGVVEKILSSGGLWSSHRRLLLDQSEFQLATLRVADSIYGSKLDAVRAEILRRPEMERRILEHYDSVDDLIRADAATLPRAICTLSDKYTPMHVTSFAAHVAPHERTGGILSLWREYGRASGVALSFNTSALLQMLSETKARQSYFALFLSLVTYGDDDPLFVRRVDGMGELAESYQCVVEAMIQGRETDGFPPTFHEASTKFSITSMLHKHPAFADEREVRLVASPLVTDEQEELPRTEPDWVTSTPGASRLLIRCGDCIEGVMIGPVEHQEHLAERTRALFDQRGFHRVPIILSDIPIRITDR